MKLVPAFAFAAGIATLAATAFAEPAQHGGRKLSTTLSGAAEVPGPGDTDGAGAFDARVNAGKGEICYTLTASNIDPANMAHIHRGAAGVAGGVVVALATPADGSSEECKAIDKALAQELIQTPEAFYVNVHNPAFAAGAIRGQLAKGS